MSKTLEPTVPASTAAPAPLPTQHRGRRWLLAALCAVGLVVGIKFFARPSPPATDARVARPAPTDPVKVVGPSLIQLNPGHLVEKKLTIVSLETKRISVPVLNVSGTVAASLRPGNAPGPDNWQFSTPEALTTYTDWLKAQNDRSFSEKQLATVRELVVAKVKFQKTYEEHLVKAGSKGAVAEHTIDKARLDTIEAELDGQKTVHESENAVRLAKRSEATLALQLEQAGLETDLLLSATPDMDIVMADVPPGSISYVFIAQKCKATFIGVRGHVFDGKVNKIVPVISKERRSLRVLFVVHDPEDQLRPGMFAEIDLGTDPRDALLAPVDGVVHVGRSDYLFVAEPTPGLWRVTEVQLGEPFQNEVEIRDGLKAGDKVLGHGAILLKPVLVQSLQASPDSPAEKSP